MRSKTWSASRRFGMARGETKPVTSITGNPASLSRSTIRTLSSVSIHFGRLCSPSRGPTSTTEISSGYRIIARPSEVGVLHGAVGPDRVRRPLGDHAPFGEHVEHVADAEHDAHLVVDEEQRQAS